MNVEIGDTWYRFEDYIESAGVDEWDNSLGPGQLRVSIRELNVTKVTRCGVRLNGFRFVLFESRKRYACPTIDLALASFLARKKKQINIYTNRVNNAKLAIHISKNEAKIFKANQEQKRLVSMNQTFDMLYGKHFQYNK